MGGFLWLCYLYDELNGHSLPGKGRANEFLMKTTVQVHFDAL